MRQWIQSLWVRWQRHRAEAASLNKEIDACVDRFKRGDPDCQLSRIMRQTENASWK